MTHSCEPVLLPYEMSVSMHMYVNRQACIVYIHVHTVLHGKTSILQKKSFQMEVKKGKRKPLKFLLS